MGCFFGGEVLLFKGPAYQLVWLIAQTLFKQVSFRVEDTDLNG
jgi:hypothetical protein